MEQPNDLILRIRAATSILHKQLESAPLSQKIMSPSLTRQQYTNYLKTLFTLHSQTESLVFPVVSSVLPDLPIRKKTGFILSDLSALTPDEIKSGSFFDDNYSDSLAFNMGLMYVIEGSTLGGLYILKNVRSVFGKELLSAQSFLSVYGEKTGSFWKDYLKQLSAFADTASDDEKEQVIAGAVYGFEKTKELFFGTPVLI